MAKVKNVNGVGFKSYLGTTCMAVMHGLTDGLMTSWFMQYLTDYAGLGAWGATLGSIILVVMRLFDAFNDPVEGWLMDKAKTTKRGKYRPFIMLSIICEAVGVSTLFFIPESITSIHWLVVVWVVVGYLIYDIGYSFFAPTLIYRSLSLKSDERAKLIIGPRMISMIMGIVTGSFVSIVTGANAVFGNLHTAFGVTVLVSAIICGIISFFGVGIIREKYTTKDEDNKEEIVKLTDIFKLFKENKALRVKFLSALFSGFIWTFLFATMMYYIKWGYCANLETGELDATKYSTLSLIGSMLMLTPLLLGTAIATPLMKLAKTPIKLYRIVVLSQAIPGGIMFLLQITGVLQKSPVLFFLCAGIIATAIGVAYIPQETINIQVMDYEVYKNGKDRSALCNATGQFLNKAQNAISSGMVGIILVAIGYEVDSVSGDFIGNIANMPTMLNWFIVVCGLVPFILGIIAYFILRQYPITPEIQKEMEEAKEAK